MPRKFIYRCTSCHKMPGNTPDEARQHLFVKKIEYRRYGFKGRLVRSRVIAWLCINCMRSDPDYQRVAKSLSERMSE